MFPFLSVAPSLGDPKNIATLNQANDPVATNLTTKGGADYFVMLNDVAGTYNYKKKDIGTSLFSTPVETFTFNDASDSVAGYETSGTDGTPAPATFNITTMYGGFTDNGNTYTFTAPAGLQTRTIEFYFRVRFGGFTISSTLSDGSAPVQTLNSGAGEWAMFDVDYSAASEGQTITIQLTVNAPTCYIMWAWLSSPF